MPVSQLDLDPGRPTPASGLSSLLTSLDLITLTVFHQNP